MAYEFKSLADVEILTEVPEGASVFAEVGGAIKRVPGEGLGGAGIKTAIIKQDGYDNALAGLQTTIAAEEPDPIYYTCTNMTFDEAYATVMSGEPLSVVTMLYSSTYSAAASVPMVAIAPAPYIMIATYETGVPCLYIASETGDIFWTAEGISDQVPSSGK